QLRAPERFGRDSGSPSNPQGTLRSGTGSAVSAPVAKTTVKTTYGLGPGGQHVPMSTTHITEEPVSRAAPFAASPHGDELAGSVETRPFNPEPLDPGTPLQGHSGEHLEPLEYAGNEE